jgi:hypothetical protein
MSAPLHRVAKASTPCANPVGAFKLAQTARFQAISPQQDADHLAGKSKRIRIRVIPKPEPTGGGGGGGN